jgi:FkbH-like protein/non-ribosomal peptide synthase protein (TIGR01720 family)
LGTRDSDVERLRTRLRWQELSRHQLQTDLRVALLASFTIDPLVPFLGTALADAGLRANLWTGPLNQVEVQCLDEKSLTSRFEPQLVIAYPRLEELWAGRNLPLDDPPDAYERDLLDLADASLIGIRRWQAELLFVLPAVPETRPAGIGDDGNTAGVLATAARAREALRLRLAGRENVAILDAESILREIGGRHAYRPDLLAAARIPFSDEYFELLGQRITRLVAVRRRAGPPLIVVDAGSLDRELTSQQAGGDARQGGPLEQHLIEVTRLGATIALCNATGPARARLAAHVPIAAWRGPERSCPEQIADLASELAGGLEHVAFLSAEPSATECVAQDLPQVRILLLPPRWEFWAPALNESGILDQIPPSRQDRVTSGGTHLAAREAVTLNGYLQRLGLDVEFAPLAAADAETAADLTRRVADFHMNGDAWPADRFGAAATGVAGGCWGVRVRDRFGDYGLSGVVAAHRSGTSLTVDLWALTCPILGKGVEPVVLGYLAGQARRWQCTTVGFDYRPTPRNDVFRQFLLRLWPGSGSPEAKRADLVLVPVADVDRHRPAPQATSPAASAGPGASQDQPRRQPANGSATARFVTASQIIEAVRARGGERHHELANDDGGEHRNETENETERALARLFASVLNLPAVGVDCNFFAHGDSMKAVELIAKANQAGLRLTLRQVFQHQTIAALAEVATKAERRDGETGVDGPVPVLPLPAWFFGRNLRRPGHFNQSQRFQVPDNIDVGALERALTALVRHHQALRMRFFATEDGWRQADPGPPDEAPFAHFDLRETRPDAWPAELARRETELQLSISPQEGRLAHFALFSFGPGRPPHLLVMFHHLAIDGISWRIILDDIQDAYLQACMGDPIRLTPVSMPVLAWAKQLSEFANSQQARAELAAWLAEPRAAVEPIAPDIPGSAGPGAFTHFEETAFTAAQTRQLRDRAVRVDRVSIDILLLAAAMRTVARWTGRRRILVDVVNHGREPFMDGVDLSRTVGWLVVNVPVLFEVDADQPPDELVPVINSQLRTWSSHHGMGDSLLRFLSADKQIREMLAALPGAELLFSYAGQFDDPGSVSRPLLGRAVEPYSADMDLGGGTPYALQFDAMIVGAQIRLTVCYREAQYHASTAETLLTGWASDLRDLIGAGSRI